MTIQAIETRYAGCRFRSRLEARWAVFFDHLNIGWEYEPQGYVLSDGTHYLPDFLTRSRPRRDESEVGYEEVIDAYRAARSARFEHGEHG